MASPPSPSATPTNARRDRTPGAVVLSSADPDRLAEAVAVALSTHASRSADLGPPLGHVPDYDGGQVSAKVVRIVSGYIDYVNRTVWRKDAVAG